MQCRDFREVADSYLSDELLVETNHDVIAHLEACLACRRELAARRELRTSLRTAFTKAEELQIQDQFAERVRRELHDIARTQATLRISRNRRWWVALAACLVIAAVLGLVVWRRQRVQIAAAGRSQETNVTQVKATEDQPLPAPVPVDADMVLAKMSELAAGDHRDCAIGHRLPDSPIDLAEAGLKYDRAYLNLVRSVMSHRHEPAEEIELVMAHACLFNGHWFGHVVVRHRGRLVSLLVTALDKAYEIEPAKKKLPEETAAQVVACSTAGGYQISCFRTVRHAVFVVSDLEEGQNLALARELAPSVYEQLTRAEKSM